MSYTIRRNAVDGSISFVTAADGSQIPNDSGNKDWQAFLLWAASQEPPVSIEPTGATLAHLRETRIAELDQWFASAVGSGLMVSGIHLAATVADQNRLASFGTVLLAALTAGVYTPATIVKLASPDGQSHSLTVAQALSVLLSYAAQCQELSTQYSRTLYAINQSTTPAEVAIPLPEEEEANNT